MTRNRRAVLAIVGVSLLAGCGWGDLGSSSARAPVPEPTLTVPVGAEPATDPAYARFYGQTPGWQGCGSDAECGTVEVPVDWQDPSGATLDLALSRYPASGQRSGSLLLNFGGPGSSGAEVVERYGSGLTTERVREHYDLVGFDPRGVGGSSGVDCLSDRELDEYRAFDTSVELEDEPEAALAERRSVAAQFAAGCTRDAGPLLGHLDTGSAARDMDVIRDALGQERLDYLGYSYGTLLGATYADELPQRVGRFVLDGALDPASSGTEVVAGQAAGIERALASYLRACLGGDVGDCPFEGTPEQALPEVAAVIAAADEEPLPTDSDRELTVGLAFTGVIAPLYDESSWPALTTALTQALAGDGTELLALADGYSQRRDDGSYSSNIEEAFVAVNCLDYPADDRPGAMDAAARDIQRAAPVLGEYMAYGEVLCGAWPMPAVRTPAPVVAAGAPPILVIGTTGDPATPYVWARALAHQLDSGVLLTYEGEGHTAYGRGSVCVDDVVDDFLVDDAVAPDGTRCG